MKFQLTNNVIVIGLPYGLPKATPRIQSTVNPPNTTFDAYVDNIVKSLTDAPPTANIKSHPKLFKQREINFKKD